MDGTITSNLILDYQKENSTLYSLSNNNIVNNVNNNNNNNGNDNNNISIEYESDPLGEEYAKLYEAPAEVIAILSLFYGGISIIAIIGNTLVIWIVATTRQMRTVTNLYIANLAFADVIIGMFCIPFQFQAALLQRWNLPEFMCAFCPFVQVLSVNVSVFTLTAIAIDRHRAIINPLRARPTKFFSKVIIITIWIAATAFSIPCAIAFRVIQITEIYRENEVIKNVTRPFCENVNLTEDQLKSYRYYLVFVQYVVPLCVISFIYIQMAIKLWGSRTPGNAQDSRDITLLRNKKKVIKMLIIVVVVFGVCWLPLQTYNILYVTWPYINEYRFINIIWFCCDWLAMSNSCYNPFIYGIYNEKFKREFNKRFTMCFCKLNARDTPDRTFSIYTRASSLRSNYTTNLNPNPNSNSNNYNYHNGISIQRYNSHNRNNIFNQKQHQQQQHQHQQQQQQQQQHKFIQQNLQEQKRTISLLKTTPTKFCNGINKNGIQDESKSIIKSKRSITTTMMATISNCNNNNNNNKSKPILLLKHKKKQKQKQKQIPQQQYKQQETYFYDDLNTIDDTHMEQDKENFEWKHDYNDRYNPLLNQNAIDENLSQRPIFDFYRNSTILITGGTGFLGKVLIQKLLTSFDIRKIYLLIRIKNGMNLSERIEKFFNESIFKYIHENKPELFNKIHPIQVNFNANDLDILPYERDLLIDEVQIVFNVVASVKFNEKLSDAIYINVLGTKKILDLVLKMKNLKSFLHVSTLYTNCNRKSIDEIVYDTEIGYEKIIRIFRILNNEHFEKLEHCLIGEMPNTYTMTKKCSENLVNHLTYNLPAGIFRAPIILSTYKEPFPGWTDNLYGPSGLCTWSAKGYIHCFYGDANKKANLIPADYCINAMITCAWDILRRYKIRIHEQTEIPVYNYIFDNNNLTWGRFMGMARKGFHEPFDKTLWYFAYFIIPSKILQRLTTFLVHNIPGHILDLIAVTIGQKKIYSKGYKKISKIIDMMSYFGLREWKFTNRNIIELDRQLKMTKDKDILEFNIESIDWNDYFYNYLSGIRKYVMKETDDRIAKKRKIFMWLYILHLMMKSSAIFICVINLWKLFKRIIRRFMPIFWI